MSLEASLASFRAAATGAASKVARAQVRQPGATAVSTPTPSGTPAPQDLKRKREVPPPPTVFSQPASTGTGKELSTKVVYAVEYLKGKNQPVRFQDIWGYLSWQGANDVEYRSLLRVMKGREDIELVEDSKEPKDVLFRFRPKHPVRSKEDLLVYLQALPTAQGIKVSELKEGWPSAIEDIRDLEAQKKILVIHNKKDNSPKTVWPNDPSLERSVDEDFHKMWDHLKVPLTTQELHDAIIKSGLKPTGQIKQVDVKPKAVKKQTKKRGGKVTNTHLLGILKDYSHMRK